MTDNQTSSTPSSNPVINAMLTSAGKLSLFVLISIALLLTVRYFTAPVIAKAEKENLLATFEEVLPAAIYNNNPLKNTKLIKDRAYLDLLGANETVNVYRAFKDAAPAGVIFTTVAPDGYSGNIFILVGILANGEVSGVRVLKHSETPGLGDKIELTKNDWILSFNGKQLTDKNRQDWAVKKDGGEFDQFTGATITPRAVVNAVKGALTVVNDMGAKLYE